jgi:TrmH family RNA methyltransferase
MMERITSPANPQIKQIRKLRDRKERETTGLFFIEGIRIVMEAIQLEAPVEKILLCTELLTSPTALKDIEAYSQRTETPILEVNGEVFKSLSVKDGPQGVGAVVRERWMSLDELHLSAGDVWIALDSIADPGNLGTILRTNDAVGGRGLILLDHCTDPYDPSAVRGSMGALFSQNLIRATLADFSTWVNRNKIAVIGTSDKAEQDYFFADYPDPLILMMGSERMGLSPAHFAICDDVVSIPMLGRSDSLNLAVATGIVLYEILNYRRNADKRRANQP